MSSAQAGMEHLRTAENLLKTLQNDPLNAQNISQARKEFTSALSALKQVNVDVQALPGISTSLPVYGSRISAALHLLPLAIELSQTGITGCDILNLLISRFHDPLSTTAQGITMVDLGVIEKDFHQITTALTTISHQVSQITPGDLQADPRLSKSFASLQQNIPQLQAGLATVERLLPLAPQLLGIGAPGNYLIEILDSTELRPGGGFIGNYGIATLSGGRLTAAHITDTYLLDTPYRLAGHSTPFSAQDSWFDLASSWGLRDSNLVADFPTAARNAEQLYKREGGAIPVQGVIAVTPVFIEHILEITGPVSVPEYQETVTSQNLIDRIHYYQLGAGRPKQGGAPSSDGISSARKRFTALLAEHLLARIRQSPPTALPQLLKMMLGSIHSKDVQVYLNAPDAENMLQSYGLDAAIQSPQGDSLFVVDANISPNKVSGLITDTIQDQVTIDTQGNALHLTTIRYEWKKQGLVYGSDTYRDYIRVYAPPGSILEKQNGWQVRGASTDFGRQVWAGFITFKYGQTSTITLAWMTPGVVTKNGKTWHYQYLIQRQAGALKTIQLQIALPACAKVVQKSSGLVSTRPQGAVLSQPLKEDIDVNIDYTC